MRIGKVWGAWASARCEDALARSEGTTDFFTLNTKTVDSIHSRARLNGSNRHIRTDVLYKCKDIDTGYGTLVDSHAGRKEIDVPCTDGFRTIST